MCGIAGILTFKKHPEFLVNIRSMADAIRHRGPDDEGFAFFNLTSSEVEFFGGNDTPEKVFKSQVPFTPQKKVSSYVPKKETHLAFAHRRLSIIDLSPTGHQPMCTHDGRYWIVYNGEIYNYIELREILLTKGICFYSNSDTEVLLNAYAHWGKECLTKFTGMFAFAIYDSIKKTLFMARDFFGIKPLYYIWDENIFSFSSEIKSLLTLPHFKNILNPQAVYEYLRFGRTEFGTETFFDKIHQIQAGYFLEINFERPRINQTRYWRIKINETNEVKLDDAVDQCRSLFLKNIKMHLRSDVDVGTALSGGIDSSAIVSSISHLNPNHEIQTFSFLADDSKLNEEKWIDIIGVKNDSKMFKVKPTVEELLADFDKLIIAQDEPFGSSSIYAQYRVMKMAKDNGIKVMIDGQGADEILGGYHDYLWVKLKLYFRNKNFRKAFLLLSQPHIIKFYTARILSMLRRKIYRIDDKSKFPAWLNINWFEDNGVKIDNELSIISQKNLKEYLRYSTENNLLSLLRYEDRNSMAHSVESRVPFLTPEFVNFLFTLDDNYILSSNGISKYVFREAMSGIVPDEILSRKDKIGFGTPEVKWLFEIKPIVDETLISAQKIDLPFINIVAMQKEWNQLLCGRREFDYRFWRWINFLRWLKLYEIEMP